MPSDNSNFNASIPPDRGGGPLPSANFNFNESIPNDNGEGAANENEGGDDNDNVEPGGDNDNIEPGGTAMGWRYRSLWDEGPNRIEVREKTWPNGKLKEREEVRRHADGRRVKHGICEKWFKDGRLEQRCEFLNGLPDGLMDTWYENGARRMTSHWAGGKLHGTFTAWDEEGTKVLEREYVYGEAL